MIYVSEETSERLVTRAMALTAARSAFTAAADGSAVSFPTLQRFSRDAGHRFSVKAARINARKRTGMKIGAYWPSSDTAGLSRGSSAVAFLDDATGRIEALVQTSAANAYRTSAACALSMALLARPDASRLAIFGAGHQAVHAALAIHEVRPLAQIRIVNRTEDHGDARVERLRQVGLSASRDAALQACESSDMVVTVTASRRPLFDDAWVNKGTHIACMGADDREKQELPVALLRRARLFADLVAQSLEVGEFQHVASEITSGTVCLHALGDVALVTVLGRQSRNDITIFDSSGIALQDIFLAERILQMCVKGKQAIPL